MENNPPLYRAHRDRDQARSRKSPSPRPSPFRRLSSPPPGDKQRPSSPAMGEATSPGRTRSGKNVYRRTPATSPRSRSNTPNGHATPPPSPSVRTRANRSLARVEEEAKPVLKWWRKYEVPRKTLHSSIGFVTIYVLEQHLWLPTFMRGLCAAFVVIVSADFIRFRWPAFERLYESLLGPLMRENEKREVNGVIYYIIGVLAVVLFWPRDIAMLSILYLSWVDTVASISGRTWGSYTPKLPFPFGRKKSVAGFIGAWATGSLTALLFWTVFYPRSHENRTSWVAGPPLPAYTGRITPKAFEILPQLPFPQCELSLIPLSVLSGAVAAVAEALDVWGLDDNVTIPVLSAVMLWGVMSVF